MTDYSLPINMAMIGGKNQLLFLREVVILTDIVSDMTFPLSLQVAVMSV